MTTLIHITVTDCEALDIRMALNATAMEWGEKAHAYREVGDHVEASTCERIRGEYHRMWEKVAKAMEDGRAFNREAVSVAHMARETFDACERRHPTGERNERAAWYHRRYGARASAGQFLKSGAFADDVTEVAFVAAQCDAIESDIAF